MTFEQTLIASDYTYQPECGAYVRAVDDISVSYLQDPDDDGSLNVWNFQVYKFNGTYDKLMYSTRIINP